MQVDHLIVAVPDLQAASFQWGARGFGNIEGGFHPDWGTANRLIVFNGAYVELIAVVNEAQAAKSQFGTWIGAQAAGGERLAGVVMRDPGFDEICRHRSLEPAAAHRCRPDGQVLRWRVAGIESMIATGLPAFIDWGGVSPHPEPGTGEIQSLELGGGTTMRAWLGTDVHSVSVFDGPAGPLRAVVRRDDAVAEIAGPPLNS